MSLIEELTALQFKVVILLATGMTIAEISKFMNVGLEAVNSILHNIYAKAGVSGRKELVLRYVNEAEDGQYQVYDKAQQFRNNVVDIKVRAHQMMLDNPELHVKKG